MQRHILRNVRNRWFPGQQHLLFEKTSRYAIISWGDEGGDSEIAGRNQTVEDLRRSWGNLRHKLEDIFVIWLRSVRARISRYGAVWTRARGVATHVFRTAQWNSRQRYIPAHVSKWLDDWLEERHAGEWPGKLL